MKPTVVIGPVAGFVFVLGLDMAKAGTIAGQRARDKLDGEAKWCGFWYGLPD